MIGRSGERGSGISVLAARHDDDDDEIDIFYVRKSSLCESVTMKQEKCIDTLNLYAAATKIFISKLGL